MTPQPIPLRAALARICEASPEARSALRADLVYEVEHTKARVGVLTAMQRVVEKRLAELAEVPPNV